MSISRRLRPDAALWTPMLLIAGASALVLAFLWARPFSWSQLFLVLFAAPVLSFSPAPVRRGALRLFEDSSAQSPAVLALLTREPLRLLQISLWLCFLVSLGEISLRTFEDLGGKRVLGLDYLWNIPAGYLILMSVAGVVGLLVSRRASVHRSLQVVVGLVAFIAGLGWLTAVVKGLHIAASVTLAAGLAVQLARVAGRHPHALLVVMRRTFIVAAIAVMAIAGGAFGWPRWVLLPRAHPTFCSSFSTRSGRRAWVSMATNARRHPISIGSPETESFSRMRFRRLPGRCHRTAECSPAGCRMSSPAAG